MCRVLYQFYFVARVRRLYVLHHDFPFVQTHIQEIGLTRHCSYGDNRVFELVIIQCTVFVINHDPGLPADDASLRDDRSIRLNDFLLMFLELSVRHSLRGERFCGGTHLRFEVCLLRARTCLHISQFALHL